MVEKTLMDHERAHTGKAGSTVRHGQNASSSNIRTRYHDVKNLVEFEDGYPVELRRLDKLIGNKDY